MLFGMPPNPLCMGLIRIAAKAAPTGCGISSTPSKQKPSPMFGEGWEGFR